MSDCEHIYRECEDDPCFKQTAEELRLLQGAFSRMEDSCSCVRRENQDLRAKMCDQLKRKRELEIRMDTMRKCFEKKLTEANKIIARLECENKDLHQNICETRKTQILLCKELKRREIHEQYLVEIKRITDNVCFTNQSGGDEKKKKLCAYKNMLSNLESQRKKLQEELSKLEGSTKPCPEELDVDTFLQKIAASIEEECTEEAEVEEPQESNDETADCNLKKSTSSPPETEGRGPLRVLIQVIEKICSLVNSNDVFLLDEIQWQDISGDDKRLLEFSSAVSELQEFLPRIKILANKFARGFNESSMDPKVCSNYNHYYPTTMRDCVVRMYEVMTVLRQNLINLKRQIMRDSVIKHSNLEVNDLLNIVMEDMTKSYAMMLLMKKSMVRPSIVSSDEVSGTPEGSIPGIVAESTIH